MSDKDKCFLVPGVKAADVCESQVMSHEQASVCWGMCLSEWVKGQD